MTDNTASYSDFFDDPDLIKTQLGEDDLFAIFESLDTVTDFPPVTPLDNSNTNNGTDPTTEIDRLVETSISPKGNKRRKTSSSSSDVVEIISNSENGQQRMSHITVERNRRKQMNEHLSVLRSLMPCFYVKRGDQASIIGGVVNYINELQQVLQALEAKKQRKVYNEVLSPRIMTSSSSSPSISSPRPSPQVLSPRKPPLSPRLINLPPISPKTPQPPTSPYKPRPNPQPQQPSYTLSPSSSSCSPNSSNSATSLSFDSNVVVVNELAANLKSAVADVEVKFCGPNVILKTVSPKIPGQAVKIISALEELSLEILHVSVSTVDDTLLNSFTIKIGIECQLSAEELAQQIQQTFC